MNARIKAKQMIKQGKLQSEELEVVSGLIAMYDNELVESMKFQNDVETYLNDNHSGGYNAFEEWILEKQEESEQ